MNKKEIRAAERAIGITFKNKQKLIHSLTHRSFIHEQPYENNKWKSALDNERLEFFGDSILSFIINKQLFQNFPDIDEGALSKYRSLLVSKKMLFKLACEIKLHHHILLGKNEKKLKLSNKIKILADSLEALIASTYLDRGLKQTEQFIVGLYKSRLTLTYLKKLDHSENDKSKLQEYLQKNFHCLPNYRTKQKKDGFYTSILFKKRIIGKGVSRAKQLAEKKAAKEALRYLKKKYEK